MKNSSKYTNIENQFNKYVLNKINLAMNNGKRWKTLSCTKMNNMFIQTNAGNIQKTYYVIQAKLGKCNIEMYDIAYKSKIYVNSGNYCGEELNEKCLKKIEKLIQSYNYKDEYNKKEQKMKEIIENNL